MALCPWLPPLTAMTLTPGGCAPLSQVSGEASSANLVARLSQLTSLLSSIEDKVRGRPGCGVRVPPALSPGSGVMPLPSVQGFAA